MHGIEAEGSAQMRYYVATATTAANRQVSKMTPAAPRFRGGGTGRK
jgi:hypothetical protein